MKRAVYIVSDPHDKERLLELVSPLERAGFTVVHNEAVGVGDSLIGTATKHLRSGIPVILCATVNAVARRWARKLVNAAQSVDGSKVLVAEMDEGLDLDYLSLSTVTAPYYLDPVGALNALIEALVSYFPEGVREEKAHPPYETQDFLDQATSATTPSIEALAEFRSQLREDIAAEYPANLSAWEFLLRTFLVREGRLTRTGALLAGEQPAQIMPSAVIECCEYHGVDRTAPSSKRTILGTLQSQIVEANKYIADRVQHGEAPSSSGPYSQPVYAYPMIAVREIVANAVAHRNYSVTSSCIHIRMFDDRIEIANPGAWISQSEETKKLLRIDDLAGESSRRNFRLASMLTWIRLVEGEGKGILAATADCQAADAPIPTVEETSGIITVTIFPRRKYETAPASGTELQRVSHLLAAGRLREAKAIAARLPSEDERIDAMQQVQAAQQRFDELLAAAQTALAVPDEARAELLLKKASLISTEDAAAALAAVPLPPLSDLRGVDEGTVVRLFWRHMPGHNSNTVYVVRKSARPSPIVVESEGEQIYRGPGGTCEDTCAPVARPVQYAVFATGVGRPSSRPSTISVTLLPPVSQLKAEVGADTIALHWLAHPDAKVQVTRTVPGAASVGVRVVGNRCQVGGLAEGQTQRFEVTAFYSGLDGAELRSAPERISATPRAEARPISTLRAGPVGEGSVGRVRVTWLPVDNSEVRIVRTDREPTLSFGATVSADDMASVGTEVTGTLISIGRETGFETELPPGVHRLVPFSIGGTGIVAGKPVTLAVTDPVGQLAVTPFTDYATVSWEWPPEAQLAEVIWRLDGKQGVMQVDRGLYRSDGGVRVPLGRGPCEVEVCAVITVGKVSFTSPPMSVTIAPVVETVIRYMISNLTPSIGPLRGRWKKVLFTAAQGCTGIRVRMVASSGRVLPTSPSGGETVLDITLTLPPGASEEHRVTIPRKTLWVRCFVAAGEARLIDPSITILKES